MRKIYKYILCACLTAGMMISGQESLWADTEYRAKMTVSTTGGGTVYVGSAGTSTQTQTSSEGGGNATFSISATPDNGYHFSSWEVKPWYNGKAGGGTVSSFNNIASTTVPVKTGSKNKNDERDSDGITYGYYTYYYAAIASFALNFYASMSVDVTSGTSGTASYVCDSGNYGVVTSGGDVQYTLTAPSPSSGYHFTGWTSTGANAIRSFGSPSSLVTTATVSAATTGGSSAAKLYSARASYAENFYAKVTLAHNGHGSANPAVSPSDIQNTETSNTDLTFTLTEGGAASGYHFTGWTVAGGTATTSTSASPLTVTVKSASTGGSSNATNCTVTANYDQNIYYARLTPKSGGHGTVSVDASPKTTVTPGGNVTFNITATPDQGYHIKQWTVTSGTGTLGSSTSASTTFTAPASTTYGLENAAEYEVTATFEQDTYGAQLSVQQSSSSVYGASTVEVSSDNINWSSSASSTVSTASSPVPFYVRATPANEYTFVGWSENNGSDTYVSTSPTYTYNVNSSSTQGGTESRTLYAVFRAIYTIEITASGTEGAGRVVFNMAGPQTYRISVPVGGSLTLKDVMQGNYTITPESSWNLNYSVNPATASTSWNSENRSSHTFTVTTKGSTKKYSESSNTITF